MFLIMGNEKVKVDTAFLSDDEQAVSGFDKNGKRLVILEGVNFENVWLEDDRGQRLDFPKKPDTNQEIEELKIQVQTLTESLSELSKKTSQENSDEIIQQDITETTNGMDI
ncbi:hypothetical protein [Bacillus atrophaeus]|uniref:hypothetical protein n=1 Tax=Bacillus atrophaeus TaxID=1452 RepID=UPI0015E75C5D|nr:hypothetical protein [Bacillus atrophaeus]MED4799127.1 hypothetical protein [Bacillus atrophaeus]MED4842781.1 hypothetical protein [Bacillus atrophaeus]MED4861360.1 hypothetical protein [Bacillus atrophaeus]